MNVLEEANKIIYGDREETYGNPNENLDKIAAQWNLYINQKFNIIVGLNYEDVCWMMADLKKIRQLHKGKRDNIVDALGYIGLIGRIDENKS